LAVDVFKSELVGETKGERRLVGVIQVIRVPRSASWSGSLSANDRALAELMSKALSNHGRGERLRHQV
jgi:hypothetical protein